MRISAFGIRRLSDRKMRKHLLKAHGWRKQDLRDDEWNFWNHIHFHPDCAHAQAWAASEFLKNYGESFPAETEDSVGERISELVEECATIPRDRVGSILYDCLWMWYFLDSPRHDFDGIHFLILPAPSNS